ncbi:MAG: DUF1343 domain-containing protein [Puniceicoccales bacterium]|jgi:uncharacterized protein YbbC (DUF1343 family)|nr:DUF1343 domain-containing protein [Puniceicoccales bacterium]
MNSIRISQKIFYGIFILFFCGIFGFSERLHGKFMNGIDVLEERKFSDIKGKKVGLLTNSGARNLKNCPTLNIFFEHKEIQLKAVFFPEHEDGTQLTSNVSSEQKEFKLGSIAPLGQLEKMVDSKQLEDRGIKVYCTHTPNRRAPEPAWLKDLNVVVIDLQDIGIRYYTYAASMLHMMCACFNNGIDVIILDRPNPLGNYMGGPIMYKDYLSFLGMFEGEPLFHGMTIAEKAHYIKERGKNFEMKCNCGSSTCAHGAFCSEKNLKSGQLKVIKMRRWSRKKTLTELGHYKNDSLIPLSPNIQNVASIFEYAIISFATIPNDIGFLKMIALPETPQRSFKYISTTVPVKKILDKIKKEYPSALKGCSLTVVKQNKQEYLELIVTDITQTVPAFLSLIFMAEAQEWIPDCDWVTFEKTQSPSSKKTNSIAKSIIRDLKKLTTVQQETLRKMKWDRLTKLQREMIQKHIGDEELVKKLFDGKSIDVNHFRNKWTRSTTTFYNQTKKYYLY